MIECSDEYIWYKKRKKISFKKLISVLLILIFLLGIFVWYKFFIAKNIFNFCRRYTTAYATEAVNCSVIETLRDPLVYSELITLEKSSTGDIVLISANSYKMNAISRDIANITKEKLDKALIKGVPIPLLAFTGLSIISGYGKTVDFKTLGIASVNCNFKSEFESVGINQTLHSIYAKVTSVILIELPFDKQEQVCETEILMCETVLVGKVPEVYLNGNLLG